MEKQSNIQIDLNTDFFKSGAVIQLDSDLFSVFWGGQRPLKQQAELAQAFKAGFALYKQPYWATNADLMSCVYTYEHQAKLSKDQFRRVLKQSLDYHCRLHGDVLLSSNAGSQKIDLQDTGLSLRFHKIDQDGFRDQFEWSQQQFQNKTLDKTVPITMAEGEWQSTFFVEQALLNAIDNYRSGFIYGEWTLDQGVLGVTPEVLGSWSKDQSLFQTMALAGTFDKQKMFKNVDDIDVKTKHEHAIVVRDIGDVLNRHLKKVQVGKTFIKELPHLYHLQTEFKATCASIEDYLLVCRDLHPTAALGFYPRSVVAIQQMQKFSLQQQRNYFGGPVGVIHQNFGTILVGIRNFYWNQRQVKIFSGCGVTADSQFDDEWEELKNKRESVLKMFSITEC